MELKPEFELLNSQFQQLYANVGVDQGFLRRVLGNIELCEHTAESDKEKAIIARAVHWWKRRASLFGMDMTPKSYPASLPGLEKEGFTDDDKRFLHSLHIVADEPSENDGA